MHLHAELLVGKENLDQQRRSGRGSAGAQQRLVRLAEDIPEPLAGVGAGGHQRIVAGKPDFTDWLRGLKVISGAEIVIASDAWVKAGLYAKRRSLGCRRLTLKG